MPPARHDLFISYRSGDLPLAEELYQQLINAGFDVWFDKIRLEPGFNWRNEIGAGRDASQIILPLVTPKWAESEWCRYETYGGRYSVPLLYEGEWTEVAPQPIHAFQFVDLRERDDAKWQALIEKLRALLQNPPPQHGARRDRLPFRANPNFVGRDSLLLQIHERLCPGVENVNAGTTAALTPGTVQALAGLGGVGKTTLAREYAERFWQSYQDILWVQAEPGLIVGQFAELAFETGVIPERTTDANADARRMLRELNSPVPRLLVLDNAEDEKSIQDWIPTVGGCRTLITSRFDHWSTLVQSMPVEVLEPEQAKELLRRSGQLENASDEILTKIAEELGYLPLALEQAAAFIRELKLTPQEWLQHYQESRDELLQHPTSGATQYPQPVATTWLMTVEHLSEPAQDLLKLLAFLAPNDIPRRMLDELASLSSEDDSQWTELALRKALAELKRYSLIKLDKNQLSVHRLVQAVQRDQMKPEQQRLRADFAIRIVNAAFPSGKFETWDWCELLVPQVQQVSHWMKGLNLDTEQAGRLLNQCGFYVRERGRYEEAEPFSLQSLELCRRLLGQEHPSVATSLNNLAALYYGQGRYEEAETCFLQALEMKRRLLGEEHPDVALSLNDLASLYRAQGRYGEAEPFYLQALEMRRRLLGQEHPDVANSLNNLAGLYRAQGRYEEAEPFYLEALEMRRRLLGQEHPDVANSLNNLAGLYRAQGRYEEAEPFYLEALELCRRLLGQEHPSVATSLNNLAGLYRAQGRYEEAEPFYLEALEMRRRLLGQEHPDVANSLNNLAGLYRAQGRYEEAEPFYLEALELCRRLLGQEHPDVANSLNNLAALYYGQSRYEEAEPYFAQALELFRRLLGKNHPHLAVCIDNYAILLRELNRDEEAEKLEAEANAIRNSSTNDET